jgi:hypothetical protein
MLDIEKSKRTDKHVVNNGRGDEMGGISRMSLKKSELEEINRRIATEGLQLNRGRRRALKSMTKKIKG